MLKPFVSFERQSEEEFKRNLEQVNQKLEEMLSKEAKKRLEAGSSLEKEIKGLRLRKSMKEAYVEILHSTEKYSVRNFQCEILLQELKKY